MRIVHSLIFIAIVSLQIPLSSSRSRSIQGDDERIGTSRCKCGNRNKPVESRIVGGVDAGRHEIPWRCYIRRLDGVFCGCSILNRKWILTAAHCITLLFNIFPLYLTIRVYAGVHNISSDDERNFQKTHVGRLYVHEEFNILTMANDIALIKVTKPLRINKYVSPVCLPYEYDYTVPNREVLISGWGKTEEQGRPSQILQVSTIKVITNQKCQELYRDKVNDNNVCTYEPGKDTCQGDSGGSIDWAQSPSECYTAIGIVSWGDGCAREDKPGVYTKIGNYLDWIKRITKG